MFEIALQHAYYSELFAHYRRVIFNFILVPDLLVGWLVGCLVGWLVGWLIGWLAGSKG